MTKILIIEAPDNTGKDTLINELSTHFKNVKVIHFTSPSKFNKSITDVSEAQLVQFTEKFNQLIKDYYSGTYDLIILNRSHLGEWVYAPMYRNEESPFWILNFENLYNKIIEKSHLLILTAPPHFLNRNDDGLSHSTKTEDRIKEILLFDDVAYLTTIPKKTKISVYDEETDSFRNLQEYTNEVLNFINL